MAPNSARRDGSRGVSVSAVSTSCSCSAFVSVSVSASVSITSSSVCQRIRRDVSRHKYGLMSETYL